MNLITPFILCQVGCLGCTATQFCEVGCEDTFSVLQHLVDELTAIGEEMSCQAECIQIIQDR